MDDFTVRLTKPCVKGSAMRSIPPGRNNPKSKISGIPIKQASIAPRHGMISTNGSKVTCTKHFS